MADKTSTDTEARDKALRDSYSAAMTTLRVNHLDEFNVLRQAEAKSRGYDWVPPKTPEQKATEAFEALVSQHPHLAAKVLVKDEAEESVADGGVEKI